MPMGPIICGVEFFVREVPNWPAEVRRSRNGCLYILHAMTAINLEFIQCYPKTPELYQCDGSSKWRPEVVYQPEPPDQESFDSIPMVLDRGWGDCDDLAAWRAADLQFRGIKAVPYLKWRDKGPMQNVYHALVKWPDGRIEDPSLALGMHGAPITRKPVFINPGPAPKPDEVIPGEVQGEMF